MEKKYRAEKFLFIFKRTQREFRSIGICQNILFNLKNTKGENQKKKTEY